MKKAFSIWMLVSLRLSETVAVVVMMVVTGDTSEFVLQPRGRQNVTGINRLACTN